MIPFFLAALITVTNLAGKVTSAPTCTIENFLG